MSLFSIIVLLIVFALIAVRQIGKFRIAIWQAMLLGAIAVLLLGEISPINALNSINMDVILFLFGMFVIGQALEESGCLAYLSGKIFWKAKTDESLLLCMIFFAGMFSAFLMNDTIAIIGTPVALHLALKHKIDAKPLLLALAFAITIGSVMSPIGNPQNLLIAINSNMQNPFFEFLKYLFIPTIINLFIVFLFIKFFFPAHFKKNKLLHSPKKIMDKKLAFLCKISLALVLALIALKITLVFIAPQIDFRLTYIALIAMIPILLFGSDNRVKVLKKLDWHTLIFFVAMFVLTQSVWNTNFFQGILSQFNINILSIPMIFGTSILLSQLISNVPLVALFQPLLAHAGANAKEFVALAAGSTIAGNLFILGAASNIIIIQNSENKSKETISFFEFAKIGIPLTIINTLVYFAFFYLL